MGNKVNIIGAGIAGLCTGCYLRMNGYDTEIFELHDKPGGLCTSWKREGYVIEGCIHWLVGSGPGDNFYDLWNELVDMRKIQFIEYQEFLRVEDTDGNFVRVLSDVDELKSELLKKAPEDKELIIEFTDAIRKLSRFNMPIDKAPETANLMDGLVMMTKFLPNFRAFKKWSGISGGDYIERCRNPLLKNTIRHLIIPEMATLFLIMTLAWLNKKSAGYPLGGSLPFIRLIEKRYLDLGGEIHYKSRVKHIITENGVAKGIELENGQAHFSDIVVSAADGHSTIFNMLKGEYVDDEVRDYYDSYEIFPSYLQVSLGVSRTFEKEPPCLVLPLPRPLRIDQSTTFRDLGFRIFNFDPTLAPEGKTLLTAMLPTEDYKYWDDLKKNDPDRYKQEKDRITQAIIDALDQRFGDFRAKVEMIDVSTPSTVMRYTNNWKGSFEGWLLTPRMGLRRMKKVLPGLKQFYMAGQWVEPGGGLPGGLLSGRNVTQFICKKDGKRFTTTTL
jgi:phytoene dehydrogenase-like protein